MSRKNIYEKKCRNCFIDFFTSDNSHKFCFCTERCKLEYKQNKKPVVYTYKCELIECGLIFERKLKGYRFCSNSCSQIYINLQRGGSVFKGKKRPEVTKKLKGKKLSKEHCEKISVALTGRKLSPEHIKACADGHRGKKEDPEVTKKRIEKSSETLRRKLAAGEISVNRHGIKSKHISKKTGKVENSDSNLELKRFQFLDDCISVKNWTKSHNIKIEYYLNNKKHFYIPDIFVELIDGKIQIEEIKGYIFKDHEEEIREKIIAAEKFCKQNGFIYKFITEKEIGIL
jgi:hypothetical protein